MTCIIISIINNNNNKYRYIQHFHVSEVRSRFQHPGANQRVRWVADVSTRMRHYRLKDPELCSLLGIHH